jgi:DNA-directed RNA polymerase subunit RPC12/RpoP
MNIFRFLLVVTLMLDSARAGTQYEVKCSDEKCSFASSLGIGGGRKFEQASGFCKKCDKMVSVTWTRGEKRQPMILSFWDALTGEVREIFKCPKCGVPFVSIDQIEELKHCPKCGKDSLKSKMTILYD